jgi:hypothetical protein
MVKGADPASYRPGGCDKQICQLLRIYRLISADTFSFTFYLVSHNLVSSMHFAKRMFDSCLNPLQAVIDVPQGRDINGQTSLLADS